MSVLTISGQVGAAAHEVGRLVAGRLNLDYVDQEILVEAARTLGVPMESVVSHDERTAGLGERLASMMRRFLESSAAAGASDPVMGSGLDLVLARTYGEAAEEGAPDVSDKEYISTLSAVIADLASHDDVLILGRGGQVILQDLPGAFHVLLAGPLDSRTKYLAWRDGVSEDEAATLVHDRAKGRADFHQKFFKVQVDDPALYHLVVNTTRFPDDAAADIIADAASRIAAKAKS